MSAVRILIVEDDPLIATDIAEYLEEIDFQVVGVAYDSIQAFQLLQKEKLDIALLDIDLSGPVDGVDIAEYINKNIHIPFVFLTSFSDRATLDRVKATQPMGYIVKPFDEKSLMTTLEIALYNFAQAQQEKPAALSIELVNQHIHTPLTEREFDILRLIYDGQTNKQIAEQLFISHNTIKTHISNLYLKLDVKTRTQAIVKIRELI
ncbi:MAG: response regulator transcription factor [Saprospiraceae bacterium]|nr:response regulator transcription factor [Saprospiraceae bacterium]